jgi:hypothetical protein
MRVLFLMGLFVLLLPSLAQAQARGDDASDSAKLAAQPLHATSNLVSTGQGPFTRPPSNQHIHCCSRKGALIGLAVGAGLAIVLTRSLCDAGDCTSTYFKSVAFFGGIGAGIGALAGNPSLKGQVSFPSERRITISPVFSRETRGGVVALRF